MSRVIAPHAEEQTSRAPNATSAVRATDLRKRYRLGELTIDALDGVSLDVKSGEFVAVMGPSGSGKSTLLYLLGLLDTPDSGTVAIEGRDTSGLDDDELTGLRRSRLGFLFQTFELIPNLSAAENILLPAEIAGQRDEAAARLAKLARQLGIEQRLGHRPRQLSGGQRQRVGLARALINEPAVVLADEPTGNLDTKTGGEVLTLLRHGVDELGWTVIMVTHDSQAAQVADRIVFLRDGRIAGEARTAETDVRSSIEAFLGS
ncbi:MAG TPA: ABC transporter ATP-binding protein [Trueperaceae bacterium]|nr:ABC transporter ATP-binding protein [Trueperaceae bacterium]